MLDERILVGNQSVDDRGIIGYVNDFNPKMFGAKRFYTVANFKKNFVRAWHGHKNEDKWIYCIKGSFVVQWVKAEMCPFPSKEVFVERRVLSDRISNLLYIPAGNYNGTMSLTDDAILLIFSNSLVDESKNDDYRLPSDYFGDCWKIEER